MEVLSQLGAALSVIALLMGVLYWLRQRGVARPRWRPRLKDKNMQVLERLHLTPQHSLHLVRLDGRRLLIAVSPQQCQLLEARPDAASFEAALTAKAGPQP